MTDLIETLIAEFARFPGVGPRQAKRFAFYLLTRDERKLKTLTENILNAKKSIAHCTSCGRLFIRKQKTNLCAICADDTRDRTSLMIVGHDVDIESIEKSDSYHGHYFVLGGTIPLLDEKPEDHVRMTSLHKVALQRKKDGLKEIVLALDANPEGEHTSDHLRVFLAPIVGDNVTISVLGKGLSTGTELQYSDPETIKSALKNRA